MERKTRIIISVISGFLTVFLLLGIFALAYFGAFSHADDGKVNSYLEGAEIEIKKLDRHATAFIPNAPIAGFIFYPGGKVEVDAYFPLMAECAKNGILTIITEMPFNLAVFDINAAEGMKEEFPEIQNWYIGGHSLGGSMAASYLDKHRSEFEGLVLLGSYSTVDFSDCDIDVLSIYGENDGVMNKEKYEANKKNLPTDTQEFVIGGGNHAGFGMYGHQIGDGKADITNEAQIKITGEQIVSFLKVHIILDKSHIKDVKFR